VVSPGDVRCVWLRHDVGNHRTSGSKLSIAKSTQEGLVLTEAELVALEKAKTEKESHGEFESETLSRWTISLSASTCAMEFLRLDYCYRRSLEILPDRAWKKQNGSWAIDLRFEEGIEVAEEWARWARYI
jgi:hypothetical protein